MAEISIAVINLYTTPALRTLSWICYFFSNFPRLRLRGYSIRNFEFSLDGVWVSVPLSYFSHFASFQSVYFHEGFVMNQVSQCPLWMAQKCPFRASSSNFEHPKLKLKPARTKCTQSHRTHDFWCKTNFKFHPDFQICKTLATLAVDQLGKCKENEFAKRKVVIYPGKKRSCEIGSKTDFRFSIWPGKLKQQQIAAQNFTRPFFSRRFIKTHLCQKSFSSESADWAFAAWIFLENFLWSLRVRAKWKFAASKKSSKKEILPSNRTFYRAQIECFNQTRHLQIATTTQVSVLFSKLRYVIFSWNSKTFLCPFLARFELWICQVKQACNNFDQICGCFTNINFIDNFRLQVRVSNQTRIFNILLWIFFICKSDKCLAILKKISRIEDLRHKWTKTFFGGFLVWINMLRITFQHSTKDS